MSDEETLNAVLAHTASTAFSIDRPERVGVAVSGGSDSMAMLHLLAEAGCRLDAVTVDHGLRPEAADEARFVAEACARLGVSHTILRWDHGTVEGNLQSRARDARYGLIAHWARTAGIGHVALGHTSDDVAETLLMELAREAGLEGLSAMASRWRSDGVTWHRPFLFWSRADLRGWLERRGLGWIEDPSNEDPRFQRVRARRALKALSPLGITAEKLAVSAQYLAQARGALGYAMADLSNRICRVSAGEVLIDRTEFGRLHPETGRLLMLGALQWVSSVPYPPRAHKLAQLRFNIVEGRDATLAGCRIRCPEGEISVTREPRAVAGMASPTTGLWDSRWRVEGPHDDRLEVRALGAEGLKLCPDWRKTHASRAALLVSPAIWHGTTLVAAPLAGLGAGWTASPGRSFAASLSTH